MAESRGPGYWKLNNSILEENEYCNMSAMQDRIHEKYKCDFDHVFESLWKGLIYLSAFIQSLNVITRGRSQDDYNYIADILYPLIEEAKTKFDGMTINAEGLLQQINSDFEQCVVDLKIKNDMLKNIVSHLNELEKELEGAQKCVDNAEHQCRIKREHLSAAENALSNAKRKLEVAKRNQIKTVVAGVATTVASFFASLFVPPLGIAGMAAGISTGIYGVTFLHKTVSTCLNNLKAAQSEVQSSESALERARNPKTEVENKLNMANKKKQQIKTQMEELLTFVFYKFYTLLDETNYMKTLCSGEESLQLASHVLQLLFLGHTGFRFPFAHYPTTQVTPSEMLLIFWQSVKMLGLFGFTVTYVSLDGAQYNRDFMKILIDGKTSETMFSMSIKNIYDSSKPNIHVIMDYSHVMKKIRNNISKSGLLNTHKKVLKFESNHIFWEHWYKAYQWDIAVNPFKIYQQLTMEHFFLTSQSKMRNKLAEDVLNENMLHLMQCYQTSLKEKGDELNSSIEFLKKTSVLAKKFRDQRPICQYSDKRLDENREVLNWFRAWEANFKQSTEIKDKEKCLLSFQTREDLTSLLVGFDEMCKDRFQRISSSIIPHRINSDVLENIFSQQRGLHNGANTNPIYLTYSRTMNTIILGEGSISRKSNTGGLSNCTTTNIYTTGTSKETCSEPCKKIRKQ
ncbi:uncharacterized protein LOC134716277 [Mytilus trossulus]|uniref:uncharacterized protein LOC134716277 n=1 Tax=Mytilus trossulus TaxID=6551 RepID=UPI003006D613